MRARIAGPDEAEAWDEFVAREDSAVIMQSWQWGEIRSRLGWEVHRVLVEEAGRPAAAAQMMVRRLPARAGSIGYVPRGPVGDWLDPEVAALLFGTLHEIARDSNAVFTKVVPPLSDSAQNRQAMRDLGFRESTHPMTPQATVLLDLRPSEEEMLASFSRGLRSSIRSGGGKGVSWRVGGLPDMPLVYEIMRDASERTGVNIRSFEHYETEYSMLAEKDMAHLLIAEYDGRPVSAYCAYRFGGYAAGPGPGASMRIKGISPSSALLWELARWSKKMGCHTFDLWGAPGEVRDIVASGGQIPWDRRDGEWGVLNYKRSFSKNLVTFVGSFDYVYAPVRYQLVSQMMAGDWRLERLASFLEARRLAR